MKGLVLVLLLVAGCPVQSAKHKTGTLIKKKIKFSSNIRKFRMEQLQSHIWLTASSYMGKYLRISSYIRSPFLIYDSATAPLWISLYMRKNCFPFLSVYTIAIEPFLRWYSQHTNSSESRQWSRKHPEKAAYYSYVLYSIQWEERRP